MRPASDEPHPEIYCTSIQLKSSQRQPRRWDGRTIRPLNRVKKMNGILAQVSGEQIARAKAQLPFAQTAEDRNYEVTIDAGVLGTVTLHFKRLKARKGKHTNWFWSAFRADAQDVQRVIETATAGEVEPRA